MWMARVQCSQGILIAVIGPNASAKLLWPRFMALDEATSPRMRMVAELESRLISAEAQMLEGTEGKPGFLKIMRRLANERIEARRKFVESHFAI